VFKGLLWGGFCLFKSISRGFTAVCVFWLRLYAMLWCAMLYLLIYLLKLISDGNYISDNFEKIAWRPNIQDVPCLLPCSLVHLKLYKSLPFADWLVSHTHWLLCRITTLSSTEEKLWSLNRALVSLQWVRVWGWGGVNAQHKFKSPSSYIA